MDSIRYQTMIKDGQRIIEEIHKVVVHRFNISDTDDPELYAAEPIMRWEESEPGQFVMKNAVTKPMYHQFLSIRDYGYQFCIIAELEKKKLSEFYLRWGKSGNNSV